MSNAWCRILGIDPPNLEQVASHREAIPFSLLIVALLERGEPMTLQAVAARFAAAGIMDEARALLSLKRCKPGRAPIYRDEDRYHLDPYDSELALWVFRLDLSRPRPPVVEVPKAVPPPLPGPEVPLTPSELDVAWKGISLFVWSQQRVALALIDAGGGPLLPREAVAAVERRTQWHPLREDTPSFTRRGSAVRVLDDGRWAIADGATAALRAARTAVRERVELARRYARTDAATSQAAAAASERRRSASEAKLAALSRAILVAFPPRKPEAVALLSVGERTIRTFVGAELAQLPSALASFDVLGAVDVRGVLRALGVDTAERRLAELGPPQKTIQLSDYALKLTTAMLVQGSCGIRQPFGVEGTLAASLKAGDMPKLRRRLESDAKSLCALYEYGRLHGTARLRWRGFDEQIPVPWTHFDETRMYGLKVAAKEHDLGMEVVVGAAPGWEEPWDGARSVTVMEDTKGWLWLVDEHGRVLDDADVQRARFVGPEEGEAWA